MKQSLNCGSFVFCTFGGGWHSEPQGPLLVLHVVGQELVLHGLFAWGATEAEIFLFTDLAGGNWYWGKSGLHSCLSLLHSCTQVLEAIIDCGVKEVR